MAGGAEGPAFSFTGRPGVLAVLVTGNRHRVPFSKLTRRRARLPSAAGLSGHYAQAEVLGERIEIPVAVQQAIAALDAAGGDHRINGPANGHAEPA